MKHIEWLSPWMDNYIKPSTKERTYIRYEQIIYSHIAPKSRNKEINELTPITLQSFVTELLSRLWHVLSTNKRKGFINDNFISK